MHDVAIVLATYNGEKYLDAQLESIVCQTYDSWHIYASDDGSTDGTGAILSRWCATLGNRMSLLPHERLGSAKKNFMHALQIVEAEVVMLCDQDDVWDCDKVGLAVQAIKTCRAECGGDKPILVFSDARVVDEELNLLDSSFFARSSINPDARTIGRLLVQGIAPGCTMAFNQKLLDIIKTSEDSDAIVIHDWWIALVAAAVDGELVRIAKATMSYRQHGSNAVGSANAKSLKTILSKAHMGKNHNALYLSRLQAQKLLLDFERFIPDDISSKIKLYAHLSRRPKLIRIMLTIRYGFWKQGVLRKVAQIVAV